MLALAAVLFACPQSPAPAAAATTSLELRVAALPDGLECSLRAAEPFALTAVVLGLHTGNLPLPGGVALAIEPEIVLGFVFADALGQAFLASRFAVGSAAGLLLHCQALALHPSRAIGAPDALAVAPALTVSVPTLDAEAELYVLFGQSNADGFAAASQLPTPMRAHQPCGRMWNDALRVWQPLLPGSNATTFPVPGRCGPETALLEELAGGGTNVHLVKLAVPMASLGPNPGSWNEWGPDANELYGELLRRIDDACDALRAAQLRPRVRGVVMMQGETDAVVPELAADYGERLVYLTMHLRARLQQRGLTGDEPQAVPFVFGLVSPWLPVSPFAHTAAVRRGQRDAAAVLPAAACVETAQLPLQADQVHFTTDGVLALGTAMARALRKLRSE